MNDYIFRMNGNDIEYVGDFEGMYENVDDPWGQQLDPYYMDRRNDVIRQLLMISPSNVLDIGCGLGHLTQAIQILVTKDVLGVDISHEGIRRASADHPTVNFDVLDIREERPICNYDAVVMSGILWYILYDLDTVLDTIYNVLTDEGHLLISQTFINNQKYGVDIIGGFSGLLDYLNKNKKFSIVESSYCDIGERRSDSLVTLRKVKNVTTN